MITDQNTEEHTPTPRMRVNTVQQTDRTYEEGDGLVTQESNRDLRIGEMTSTQCKELEVIKY